MSGIFNLHLGNLEEAQIVLSQKLVEKEELKKQFLNTHCYLKKIDPQLVDNPRSSSNYTIRKVVDNIFYGLSRLFNKLFCRLDHHKAIYESQKIELTKIAQDITILKLHIRQLNSVRLESEVKLEALMSSDQQESLSSSTKQFIAALAIAGLAACALFFLRK